MQTSRYTEPQIIAILRQAKGGVPVVWMCGAHVMGNASFCKWRAKHGGMDASMIRQMQAFKEDSRGLKRMDADLSMQTDRLKETPG